MLRSMLFMLGFIAIGIAFGFKAVKGRIQAKAAQTWPKTKGKVLTSEVTEDRFRSVTGKASIAFIPEISYQYFLPHGGAGSGRLRHDVRCRPLQIRWRTGLQLQHLRPGRGNVPAQYTPLRGIRLGLCCGRRFCRRGRLRRRPCAAGRCAASAASS